jgi:hypothetical protein
MHKCIITMCIRDPNSVLHKESDMGYPWIHELGHAACKEAHHVEDFWIIFRVLQLIARTNKFWNPGSALGFRYCRVGINVDHPMPELFPADSPEYKEVIQDMVSNTKKSCIPPTALWKTKVKSNRLIAAIMTKIPDNDV